MVNALPDNIEDLKLIHSDCSLIDPQNVISKTTGKFFIVAQWHTPTYPNSYGMMVYDCYVLAWNKDGNDVFATLKYDQLEPKSVLNLWSVPPLLKMTEKEFDLNEFIERIRKHRLTGV
jgi:hypothetical protein